MKPKLDALQTVFPDIDRTVLQDRLAAAEGYLTRAVQVSFLPLFVHSFIKNGTFYSCQSNVHHT